MMILLKQIYWLIGLPFRVVGWILYGILYAIICVASVSLVTLGFGLLVLIILAILI